MDDFASWKRRRDGATDKDHASGLVFDGVITYLEKELGADAVASLRADARVPKRILALLKYPVVPLLDLISGGAERLVARGDPLVPTLHAMGAATCGPYMQTPVGQFLASANGGNLQRIVGMIDAIFSTAYTYGKLTPSMEGERAARLVATGQLFGPAFFGGIMQTGLGMIGRQDKLIATPTAIARDGLDFTLEIRW